MSSQPDTPTNAFAAHAAATPAPAPKAEPVHKFAGIGAKVQGRPGESMASMATRMHGRSK
jgi:hypothetical protein